MKKSKCLLVTMDSLQNEPNFELGSRGDRKLLVTSYYKNECPCETDIWQPRAKNGLCPVQIMDDTESAVFNQNVKQDRHYHKLGTEMYMLLTGKMSIEVEDKIYNLVPGDMIIVNPESFHKVLSGTEFLCRVLTVNCHGPADKYMEK